MFRGGDARRLLLDLGIPHIVILQYSVFLDWIPTYDLNVRDRNHMLDLPTSLFERHWLWFNPEAWRGEGRGYMCFRAPNLKEFMGCQNNYEYYETE